MRFSVLIFGSEKLVFSEFCSILAAGWNQQQLANYWTGSVPSQTGPDRAHMCVCVCWPWGHTVIMLGKG